MAKRPSPVYIGRTKYAGVEGLESILRGIASLPDEVIHEVKPELKTGADAVVKRFKRRAPVSDLEGHSGAYRDSAHTEAGAHELAVDVVVDATDEHGDPIGKHVELGHLAPDGSHVAGQPAFYPALRTSETPIRRGVKRALIRATDKVQARMAGT